MKFKWQHPRVPQISHGCLSRVHWIQKSGEKSLFIVATSCKEIETVCFYILEQFHKEILTKISLKYMFKDFSLLEIAGKGELEKMRQAMFSLIYFVSKFATQHRLEGSGEHGSGPDVGTRRGGAAWPLRKMLAQ